MPSRAGYDDIALQCRNFKVSLIVIKININIKRKNNIKINKTKKKKRQKSTTATMDSSIACGVHNSGDGKDERALSFFPSNRECIAYIVLYTAVNTQINYLKYNGKVAK